MRANTTTLICCACAVAGWLSGKPAPEPVAAAGSLVLSPLVDQDSDFLPDVVEWVVLTNATNPDTDGDGSPDFVEVVQYGNPRVPNDPLPIDQEMRLVITGPSPGSGETLSWMHILLRVVGNAPVIERFAVWAEFPGSPGLRVPLNAFAAAGTIVRERQAGPHGHWIHVAVPLVPTAVLHQLLPCTICAESTVSGRKLASGVQLFSVQGQIATLVPFGNGTFALQTLAPEPCAVCPEASSNKVCVLTLQEVGSEPGGVVYEVVDATCEDCNELECGPSCLACIGWIVTIPGAVGTSDVR